MFNKIELKKNINYFILIIFLCSLASIHKFGITTRLSDGHSNSTYSNIFKDSKNFIENKKINELHELRPLIYVYFNLIKMIFKNDKYSFFISQFFIFLIPITGFFLIELKFNHYPFYYILFSTSLIATDLEFKRYGDIYLGLGFFIFYIYFIVINKNHWGYVALFLIITSRFDLAPIAILYKLIFYSKENNFLKFIKIISKELIFKSNKLKSKIKFDVLLSIVTFSSLFYIFNPETFISDNLCCTKNNELRIYQIFYFGNVITLILFFIFIFNSDIKSKLYNNLCALTYFIILIFTSNISEIRTFVPVAALLMLNFFRMKPISNQ